MDFYFIVSAIAIVSLILILTFFGVLMQNKNSGQTFPINALQCPDYWTYDGSYCVSPATNLNQIIDPNSSNKFNTATPGLPKTTTTTTTTTYTIPDPLIKVPINFGHVNWTNGTISNIDYTSTWNPAGITYDSSLCAIKTWTNYYGVHWDGVSNTNQC